MREPRPEKDELSQRNRGECVCFARAGHYVEWESVREMELFQHVHQVRRWMLWSFLSPSCDCSGNNYEANVHLILWISIPCEDTSPCKTTAPATL